MKLNGLTVVTEKGLGKVIEQNGGYVSVNYAELGGSLMIETISEESIQLAVTSENEAWLIGQRLQNSMFEGKLPSWVFKEKSERDMNAFLKVFIDQVPYLTKTCVERIKPYLA